MKVSVIGKRQQAKAFHRLRRLTYPEFFRRTLSALRNRMRGRGLR